MNLPEENEKTNVFSAKNILAALVVHILLFLAIWFFGNFNFKKKEVIIPIELTVAMGTGEVEETPPEPPPPEPEPESEPQPKPPTPPPEPPKPQPTEEIKKDALIDEKIKKVKEIKPPKPVRTNVVKRVEDTKPQKTAKELLQERIAKMRAAATDVKVPKNVNYTSGGEQRPPNWKELLNKGYIPGKVTTLAPNETSRCLALLKRAIDDRWRELSPRTGSRGTVNISIKLNKSGDITTASLISGTGDPTTDAAALKVVRSVGNVRGLSSQFLERYSKETITIRYTIESIK
jgi:protein TonB